MRSRNVAYIPEIDHLRLLAALLVFFFHFFHFNIGTWTPWPDQPWFGLVTEGHTGVSLFFVLSGFIFMTIAEGGGSIAYWPFLRNRLLRIAPLFLVVFLVAISIGRDRFEATDVLYILFTNLGDAPTSWHFATGPAWSISVEFSFYMVFPFLAVFAREKGKTYLVKLIALLLVVKIATYLATANSTHTLYSTLVGRFDQFLIGMLAAMIFAERREFLQRNGRTLLIAAAVLLVVAVGGQARWASFFAGDQKQPFWIVWGTVEAVAWAFVLLGYLSAKLPLSPRLDRALCTGGEWSFSIYMWHALVIFTVHELFGIVGGPGRLVFALNALAVLAATLAFAWLSYTTIEKPFLAMRGRYRQAEKPTRERVEG